MLPGKLFTYPDSTSSCLDPISHSWAGVPCAPVSPARDVHGGVPCRLCAHHSQVLCRLLCPLCGELAPPYSEISPPAVRNGIWGFCSPASLPLRGATLRRALPHPPASRVLQWDGAPLAHSSDLLFPLCAVASFRSLRSFLTSAPRSRFLRTLAWSHTPSHGVRLRNSPKQASRVGLTPSDTFEGLDLHGRTLSMQQPPAWMRPRLLLSSPFHRGGN